MSHNANFQDVINRFKHNLFDYPFCSDGKGYPTYRRRVENALRKPLIQPNGPRCIKYLYSDIDRNLGALAWEEANLPFPTLVMTRPSNGHAHLIYELAEPIWLSEGAEYTTRAARYALAVWDAIDFALDADTDYNRLMIKNPVHPQWTVTCGRVKPYTLSELTCHLDLEIPRRSKIITDQSGSRHLSLFRSALPWGCKNKNFFHTLPHFQAALQSELEHLNLSFKIPLPTADVRAIAKNSSRKIWNYAGEDAFAIKQRHRQLKSAQSRVSNNINRIVNGIQQLRLTHRPINQTQIIKLTGLSNKTVIKHWTQQCVILALSG